MCIRDRAQGAPEDIIADLKANFEGECSEVGMYLAMARVAHREGYPEIGLYWEKAAFEEAEHAAKFAELLGEVVTDSTKKNLEMRVDAENGATAGKFDLAKRAKAANLDAIHEDVYKRQLIRFLLLFISGQFFQYTDGIVSIPIYNRKMFFQNTSQKVYDSQH